MSTAGHDAHHIREEAARRRRARQEAARLKARRQRFTVFVTVASLVTLVIAFRALIPAESGIASDWQEPRTEASLIPANAPAPARAAEPPLDPITPVFASYRTLQLFLPVMESDLTEVAFHQASGNRALPMESTAPDADMDVAADKTGTGRIAPQPGDETPGESAAPGVLGGEVLRMWRSNRRGAPDTAADVGAAPGSAVYAPVTGTVLEVKSYLLYDKHEDLEIHIQPEGWPEIDLVIIHITDPVVRPGDRVWAGATRIASVRMLSDRVNHQLADYLPGAGDHIHLQLNRVEEPGATLAPDGS